MVRVVKQRVSIEHLLPESGRCVLDYLKEVSRRLFTAENNAQNVESAYLKRISKEAAVNIIADVYSEESSPRANRIWKIREKRDYPNRRTYEYESFILRWLQERHAPVPALIAQLVDITKKDELRKELSHFVKPEDLDRIVERGPEREGLVMRALKEPRHDLDLAYLAGKLHSRGIDQAQRNEFRRQLYKISAMALESIITLDMIGNLYNRVDLRGDSGVELVDPLGENPDYYADEISKNIERIVVANLIEQRAMQDSEDEIRSYKLPPGLEKRIKHVFAPVLKYLADKKYRGFVHGETQPFHLAMHESPGRAGQPWQGYHLFDFDKSRIDNVLLEAVRYLNNPIASLPVSMRRKLYLGGVVHAVKTILEIQQDPVFDSHPIKLNIGKKRREELQRFSITNLQRINSFKPVLKGLPVEEIMKMKDYLSLFAYIELAGRASKTGYGLERSKYADLDGRIDHYQNSVLMPGGRTEPVEFGKYYEPDRERRYCAHEMHTLLDRMIKNKKKKLGYRLSPQEVDELKAIRTFLEDLNVEYHGKTVPVKYFNPIAK